VRHTFILARSQFSGAKLCLGFSNTPCHI
jgi:hypothetical protein